MKLVYSLYICNAPVDVEKILQLYMIPVLLPENLRAHLQLSV